MAPVNRHLQLNCDGWERASCYHAMVREANRGMVFMVLPQRRRDGDVLFWQRRAATGHYHASPAVRASAWVWTCVQANRRTLRATD